MAHSKPHLQEVADPGMVYPKGLHCVRNPSIPSLAQLLILMMRTGSNCICRLSRSACDRFDDTVVALASVGLAPAPA